MKIFFSESKADYATYTFNYGIYCLQENPDELDAILDQGFLPYSGNPQLTSDLFYLARSLRINAELHQETSENRRVNRKLEPENIQLEIVAKSDFVRNDAFNLFCEAYAAERMNGQMPLERINYLFQRSTCTHLFCYTKNEQPVGYVICALTETSLQYWFSFFDLRLMQNLPIGKWMMGHVIQWALQNGRQYIYLGTCYEEKSLYKIRDFKGLQFFDGYRWNADVALLKAKCKTDAARGFGDDLKLSEDMDGYLERHLMEE